MSGPNQGNGPEGALLSEDQIKRLKIAIAIMSLLLIVGLVTLVARVVYLVNRGDPAPAAVAAAAQTGSQGAVQANLRLLLPAGAQLKASSLSGNRLVAHYASSKGDGLIILDLATGKQSTVAIAMEPF